jgi:hypothetical protein
MIKHWLITPIHAVLLLQPWSMLSRYWCVSSQPGPLLVCCFVGIGVLLTRCLAFRNWSLRGWTEGRWIRRRLTELHGNMMATFLEECINDIGSRHRKFRRDFWVARNIRAKLTGQVQGVDETGIRVVVEVQDAVQLSDFGHQHPIP